MKDIYDIDWVLLGNMFSLENMGLFLVILFFLYLVYLFINRLKVEKKEERFIEVEKEKINYLEKIEKIEENILGKDFLQEISKLFRIFLEEEKEYKNFSKKTLEEILEEKNIEKDYRDFLKKIYFREYNGEDLELEARKEIILELIKIFEI